MAVWHVLFLTAALDLPVPGAAAVQIETLKGARHTGALVALGPWDSKSGSARCGAAVRVACATSVAFCAVATSRRWGATKSTESSFTAGTPAFANRGAKFICRGDKYYRSHAFPGKAA